jgi:hypothetical protein
MITLTARSPDAHPTDKRYCRLLTAFLQVTTQQETTHPASSRIKPRRSPPWKEVRIATRVLIQMCEFEDE